MVTRNILYQIQSHFALLIQKQVWLVTYVIPAFDSKHTVVLEPGSYNVRTLRD